jgi:hypothetical protein
VITAPLSATLSPVNWRNEPSTRPLLIAGAWRTTAMPVVAAIGVGRLSSVDESEASDVTTVVVNPLASNASQSLSFFCKRCPVSVSFCVLVSARFNCGRTIVWHNSIHTRSNDSRDFESAGRGAAD